MESWEEEIRKQNLQKAIGVMIGFDLPMESINIEKARSGVYTATSENKKLGRVGQKYGSKKQEDAPTNKADESFDNIDISLIKDWEVFLTKNNTSMPNDLFRIMLVKMARSEQGDSFWIPDAIRRKFMIDFKYLYNFFENHEFIVKKGNYYQYTAKGKEAAKNWLKSKEYKNSNYASTHSKSTDKDSAEKKQIKPPISSKKSDSASRDWDVMNASMHGTSSHNNSYRESAFWAHRRNPNR